MTVTSTWFPGMGAAAMSAGQAAMQTGYELSNAILTDAMSVHAPEQLEALNGLKKVEEPRILVVDGCFDHMHHLLEHSKIPHARVDGGHLLTAALAELPQTKWLLINCARDFPSHEVGRVARFVEDGGFLMTSDWALKNVVEAAFPNTIRHNGKQTGGNVFVDIELRGFKSRLLEAAFDAAGEAPKWWLETCSFPMQRLSKDIDILIYSPKLREKYGNGSIMVTFPWGAGRVYHMISHAFLQQKGPRGPGWKPMSTTSFTTSFGTTKATTVHVAKAEEEDPEFDGTVAAATTISTAAFLAPILGFNGHATPEAAQMPHRIIASKVHGAPVPDRNIVAVSPVVVIDGDGKVYAASMERWMEQQKRLRITWKDKRGRIQVDSGQLSKVTGIGRYYRVWLEGADNSISGSSIVKVEVF